MAFAGPLDFSFEIYVGGTWVDVGTDVHEPSGLVITQGGDAESERPGASTARFVLDNILGDYSPRYPIGAYYGSFGQNTPFRLNYNRIRDTAARTTSNGWGSADTGQAWTSDTTVGGAALADFSTVPGALRHSVAAANQWRQSYFAVSSHRTIELRTDFSLTLASITGAPVEPANVLLRGTSSTVFLLARVQITTAGAFQFVITDSTGTLLAATTVAGLTYAANTVYRLRALVEGQTIRMKLWTASAVEPFGWQASAHSTLTPASGWVGIRSGVATGNTNTKPIVFSYSNVIVRQPRHSGELADIDVDWRDSENTVRTMAKSAGIRRRLGQGASPLTSTLRRGYLSAVPAVVAYWPLEDAANALSGASGVANGWPMTLSGTIGFASYSTIPATKPIPTLKVGYLDGLIQPYTAPSPNAIQLRWLGVTPDSPEIPNDTYLMDLHNTGTAGLWRVMYGTTGSLRVQAWSNAFAGGADLLDSGYIAFAIKGQRILFSLELTQNGANVDWKLVTLEVGQTSGLVTNGTLTGKTIGVASRVFVDPLKLASGMAIGHVAVHPNITSIFSLYQELNAWVAETAGARIQRLCGQLGVPFSNVGVLSTTPAMGPQLPLAALTLLDECVDVDRGVLYDSLGETGFTYRTRTSLYDQTATLDLDYSLGHVEPGFKPRDDDQLVRNDITLTRVGGSSARVTLDVGRKSTLDPSAGGAGRYDTSLTVNPQTDDQLPDLGYWILSVLTVNDPRYPEIGVEIANDQMINAGKLEAALAVTICDLLTVSNPPIRHSPDQIKQLAKGYVETIRNFQYGIVFFGTPASPYDVVRLGAATFIKVDNDTSTLSATATTTATSFTVASTGDLWSTVAGDYPVDLNVAGEVARCTAVAGAASPQTLTVVRSINGVVKTQAVGAVVRLNQRPTLGL